MTQAVSQDGASSEAKNANQAVRPRSLACWDDVADAPDARAVETPFSPQKLAILQAAQLLFIQRGYDGVSIRDLAAECGLAKATIYHHFRDKEDLFFSVLEHDLLTMHAEVMQGLDDSQPVLARLHASIEAYFVMLRDRRTGVMWSVHENTQLKAHLQHFFRRNIRLILDPWIQILNQGKEEGVFRTLDSQLSALTLLSMLNSTVLYQMHFRGDIQDADLVEHVYNLFVQGVRQN
jgi:TetR/AcrR family transcriptional regulator, cholesterol catabolism regulator